MEMEEEEMEEEAARLLASPDPPPGGDATGRRQHSFPVRPDPAAPGRQGKGAEPSRAGSGRLPAAMGPLLLALLTALGLRAEVLPPSNVSYSVVQICTLKWTWKPPENVSSSCDLEYSTDIAINGILQGKSEWSKKLFRVADVPMNKEVSLKVRSECKSDNATNPSDWAESLIPPKGVPDTEASNISCIWHNLKSMVCTWLRGKKASDRTKYTLYYWYEGLQSHQQCEDYHIHEGTFRCAFKFALAKSLYPTVNILVRGDSEEVRPICENKDPTTIVKPGTPKIVKLFNTNNGISIEWQQPDTFPSGCLVYEVEYKDSKSDTTTKIENRSNKTEIPSIHPKFKYTFKVRAKASLTCYSSQLWSDWSEEKSIGEESVNSDSTFYITLIVVIPLIVAVSTIILLVYLQRLKILILPPIPDPREILKRMFLEQNEDPQNYPKDGLVYAYDKLAKEEEINPVIWIEVPETAISGNKH
ncbi:interleukin-13 receptor subunit alpha-1 [Alligator mississippiensis]|uniref:interleukin-13 receptor subunit alpha-1 n=1 Tax=Alligator mississippiensis TaxID=8496 RepID=UPI00287780B7|nr:interleukin-13 receptor subunit alpha-1 [Alligator mississippiensis]